MTDPIMIWRGAHIHHIAPCPTGAGYLGMRDGRVIGKAETKADVMRLIILSARWLKREPSND